VTGVTRLFVDLSDGIHRTYDVSRYAIEYGVLRLFASVEGVEAEVAAFSANGWLRFERELPQPDIASLD
jgi:hypothetical protein